MKADIDRTIEKLKLVVEKMKVVGDSNYWTMKEHEQIAEWLEELKRRREHEGENMMEKLLEQIAEQLKEGGADE